jgi:hypothetical protein
LPLLIIVYTVKRAFKFCDSFLYQVKINEGGFYGRMPKESFDGVKICSLGKKVSCKAMAFMGSSP